MEFLYFVPSNSKNVSLGTRMVFAYITLEVLRPDDAQQQNSQEKKKMENASEKLFQDDDNARETLPRGTNIILWILCMRTIRTRMFH